MFTKSTARPPIAQLVERETVVVQQLISLGHWFESGWAELLVLMRFRVFILTYSWMAQLVARPAVNR
jgi:hypothetical protein